MAASSETRPGQGALTSLGDKLVQIQRLDHQASYEAARKLAHAAVDEVNGLGNSPVLAEVEYRLGHLLTYLGEHEEAGTLLRDAAELAARFDMKALAVDIWLYRLKHALVELEDKDLARSWLEVTWYTLLQTGDDGGGNLRRAEYEEALGLLASREGDSEKARMHHAKSLEIREAALGASNAALIDFLRSKSLNNLANVEQAAGRHDEAVPLYQEALALREKVFGPDHPEVGQVLFNLGLSEVGRGKYPEAIEHLARALAIEESLPAPRTDTLLSRRLGVGGAELYAHLYDQAAGNQASARAHLDRAASHAAALETVHRRLAQERPAAMQDRARIDEHVFLAGIHGLREEYQPALTQLEAVLRIREHEQDATQCGPRQNTYREDLVSAAYLLCEVGRTAEARAHVEKALNPAVSCQPDITADITKRIQEEITRPTCRP